MWERQEEFLELRALLVLLSPSIANSSQYLFGSFAPGADHFCSKSKEWYEKMEMARHLDYTWGIKRKK